MKRASFALAAGAAVAVVASASGAPTAFPRPAPQLRRDVTAPVLVFGRNTACTTCHGDVAHEWASSRHNVSFTNDAFRASLAREPEPTRPFCRGCHAPEAPPELDREDARHALGVGCVTCHVPLGPVLAADEGDHRTAPHALVRTSAFSGVDACASCHTFSFPDGASGDMQRTVTEHEERARGATCQTCHMPALPNDPTRRSHVFRGGYDESFVRGALDVSTRRESGAVVVTLSPRGVTHAVPTGDLFRRLAVEVTVGERQVTRYLARHFVRGMAMDEVADDRVHGEARTVSFPLDRAEVTAPISWRVVYQRVASQPGRNPEDAPVESEFEVAHGIVTR